MASLSKLLYYSCYEAAHPWHHSCSAASLELLIIGFINGFKIYFIVYLLSAIVTKKKFTKETLKKIFRDNLQSASFLAVNAGTFVSAHCLVRAVLQHINYISAAYIPALIASLLAVNVERQSRRSLLAVYVTNVASECAWNILVSRGYIRPLPYGDVLMFSLSMALFGYHFKKVDEFSPFVRSVMQLVLGKNESAKSEKVVAASENSYNDRLSIQKPDIIPKSIICKHSNSCWRNWIGVTLKSFCKGYLLQGCVRVVASTSQLLRNPSAISGKLVHPSCLKMALFLMWFSSSFQGVCCLARSVTGRERPLNGAVAGAIAGLGLVFSPSTSLTLYAFWKAVEAFCDREQKAERLPRIPGGVEMLYGLSTAYLFHLSIMENFNLKPSYWRFLLNLTNNRIGECNRLLLPYGLDSGKNQLWPKYDVKYLSESFKREFSDRL